MNHAYTLFSAHVRRAMAGAEQSVSRIRRGTQRADDDAAITAADTACDFSARLYYSRAPSMERTYAPLTMRRRDSACGPWTLYKHTIAAGEASVRSVAHEGYEADVRAYRVARHYMKALRPT